MAISPTPNPGQSPLTVNGLAMPADFPAGPFEAVYARISSTRDVRSDPYLQFAGAWNAISYRMRALEVTGAEFTASLTAHGAAPAAEERYRQEQALFNFFASGYSAFEAFFYGTYAIGTMLNAAEFPFATAADQRRVNSTRTIERYERVFLTDPFVEALRSVTTDASYRQWSEIRNVLSHRTTPGRRLFVTFGGEAPTDQWKLFDIPLDGNLAATRRRDALALLSAALVACQAFVEQRFS